MAYIYTVTLVYKDTPKRPPKCGPYTLLYTGPITWEVYPWGPVKCGLYIQVVFIAGLTVIDKHWAYRHELCWPHWVLTPIEYWLLTPLSIIDYWSLLTPLSIIDYWPLLTPLSIIECRHPAVSTLSRTLPVGGMKILKQTVYLIVSPLYLDSVRRMCVHNSVLISIYLYSGPSILRLLMGPRTCGLRLQVVLK